MTATATPRAERIRSNSADRRTRAKEDTKRTILNAATALFEARGYDGFSLRQVAEGIGYTATTIYLYFKDKDELFHAMHEWGFEKLFQEFERNREIRPGILSMNIP